MHRKITRFVVGVWWGIVHLVDMFFNKLVWWQEPLTIIPFLVVGIPSLMLVELYGKNPMHWWPIFWGTKVTIPEREPFRAYDKEMEKSLKEFGPTRVYVLDYTTLKFRTKKENFPNLFGKKLFELIKISIEVLIIQLQLRKF